MQPLAAPSSVGARGSRARTRRAPGPSSSGRPGRRRARTASCPARPGAGVTITRSWVMSSMRHVDAPSRNVSPRPALVDHLLVELADARAVGQEHAEQPAVGDRAAAGDGQALGAVAGADRVVDAVPHEARPQLGELLARVAAASRSSTLASSVVGEVGEARRSAGPARPSSSTVHSSDRAHARRSAGRARRAGCAGSACASISAVEHAPRDDGRLEQVAAVLREDRALARLADLVAGAADALQPAADRARRLDLDRRGRPRPCRCPARATTVATSARSSPRFSSSSMTHPLLAAERAVVGASPARRPRAAPRSLGRARSIASSLSRAASARPGAGRCRR